MPLVSVVIPTYRSGEGLDRAIASLDAQTLAQDDLEVLLLDDGSPDDTGARITALAADRPNYRAFVLEASGWPSRPRNVGVREARGEYVLFLDHDDELYPRSLAEAVRLGRQGAADVVNGKEVRTHRPGWGTTVHTFDSPGPDDTAALGMRRLLPMTPHKLYRRAFLLEHDIRFPEGPRHLWEDLFFNVDVARHDPRVALLSSVPFYHWRETGENNSAPADGTRMDYAGDPEYWAYLDKLLRHVGSLPPGRLRDELLAHNAGVRLASQLGTRYATASAADRERIVAGVGSALEHHVPAEVEELMTPRVRTGIRLFRAGHVGSASAFLRHGEGHAVTVGLEEVTADRDGLRLRGTLRWGASDDGRPLLRVGTGGAVERVLDDAVLADLAAAGEDATVDVAEASAAVLVRHRGTRACWALPTSARVGTVTDGAGDGAGLALEVAVEADFDPATAAAGGPLVPGRHQLYLQVELDGRQLLRRARLHAPPGPLADGRFELTADEENRAVVVLAEPPAAEAGHGAGAAPGWRRAVGRLRRR